MITVDKKGSTEKCLPVIALRGLVIYPQTVVHFDAGRERSVAALNRAMETGRVLFVVAQKNAMKEEPALEDLYTVGTVVEIKQIMPMPDGVFRLMVEGISRAALVGIYDMDGVQMAQICAVPGVDAPIDNEARATSRVARKMFEKLSSLRGDGSPELRQAVAGERDPGALADLLAANLLEDLPDRQAILECADPVRRVEQIIEILQRELDVGHLEKKIEHRVHERIDHNNREYYLHEQMHAIEEELGEGDDDVAEYERKLAASPMDGEARERTEKELKRLKRLTLASPESSVMQNYIEYMLELPWGAYDDEKIDVKHARAVLEADHYALEDVKKRILEFLAVRSLKKDSHGPILCLTGAPGVGKTSIARSVARALGREFCQVSLGGVYDEAEIRGHRRTYVAAMPGRVISAIKQCGRMNPVFLFDEIDKMASNMRGDPAAAMLEVLDPEQNSRFRDHYLEAPFDLSKVLFITTANNAEAIPKPLYDRMEVIEVPSYTQEEKLQIAKRHLWKKQLTENGLNGNQLRITEAALARLIDGYTREAGVRSLERRLGAICRKAAAEMLEKPDQERRLVTVKPENLAFYLGAARYTREAPRVEREVGVVNGLAWTSVGGEVMPIEVAVLPGDGKIELTGSLGDVMKESARIALSYVRAHMKEAGISEEFRLKHDIHVHVPEGATPKDGPSAGVAMACAIFSAVSGIPARQDVAMTGEISLRGRAMPIGGLKEKLLAAYRAGMKTVLIPKENEKDLEEISGDILEKMDVRTMTRADEALAVVMPETRLSSVKAVV